MDTTDKVLSKLNIIRTIFISAFNSYQTWKYLRTLKDKNYKFQVENNLLFRSLDYYSYFNMIIELAKLIENKENTQRNNIHLFFQKLEKNLNISDFSSRIDLEFINGKNKEIAQLTDSIKIISKIRNKFYAHTEKQFVIPTKLILGFDEFDKMFNCIENIITSTYFRLTDTSENIKIYSLQKATEYTIRELVNFQQLKSNSELELWKYKKP